MAKLAHPNVVTVLDVGDVEGHIFVAMELVEGGNLLDWMKRNPIGPRGRWRAALPLMAQVCRGLAAAHAAGIVHRDIKPHNLLIDGEGRVKVGDFGLARAPIAVPSGDDSSTADVSDADLTGTGAVTGTPSYMAPEQYGGSTDAQSDQFSLCVTFWELLCGELPFVADDVPSLSYEICCEAPSPMPEEARVPSWLTDVLHRGLAKKPEERFESIEVLRVALRRGSRKRSWLGLGALGLCTALAVVGVGLIPHPSEETRCVLPDDTPAKRWRAADLGAVRERFADGRVLLDDLDWMLERYGQRWDAQWRAACQATWVDGTHDATVLDERMHCLASAKAHSATLVELLETVDEREVL